MTHKSPEVFTAICDFICATPSYATAATRAGVGVSTFWRWIAESQREPEQWSFEYLGETIPFHMAVKAARRIAIHEIEAGILDRAKNGTDEKVFFQGRPTWQEREDLVGLDDETIAMLGYPDRYLRDRDGRRVQNVIHHAPPTQLALAVVSANMPKTYGSHQTIDVTQRSSGVTVIRHERVAATQPKTIEHVPRMIEQVAKPEPEIIDRTLSTADAPPIDPLVAAQIKDNAAVIANEAKVPDLRRDLEQRAPQKAAQTPGGQYVPMALRGKKLPPPIEDGHEGIGVGVVKPGGMKMA